MESIADYDVWKLASPPEDILEDDEINRLERTATDCPFAHDAEFKRPYFQETEEGWFVTCDCGTNLGPKADPMEAMRCWNTRVAQTNLFREGPRAFNPGI